MFMEKYIAIFSALSFLYYSLDSLYSTRMINEYVRWGYGNQRRLISFLQILASLGLLLGLYYKILLSIVSFFLVVMMIFAMITRIKVKDSILKIFPSFFYILINTYIFYKSIINYLI